MRSLLPIAIAALVAFVAVAQAGTQEDPEISDAAGDTAAPESERDLVAAWIEDALDTSGEEPAVVFSFEFAGEFQGFSSLHAQHERVRFAFVPNNDGGLPDGAVEAYLNMRPSTGTTSNTGEPFVRCHFGTTETAGESQDLNSEVSLADGAWDGTVGSCLLPVSNIGGYDPAAAQITNLYADYQLVVRGPVTGDPGGDIIPETVVEDYDRAPDDGFGRVFGASGGGNETGNQTQNETGFEDVETDLVVSEDGMHESGNILAGDAFVFQFSEVGLFSYHDHMAPNVTGSIDVVDHGGNGNDTDGNGTSSDQNATSEGVLHVVQFNEGDGNDTSTWSFEPAELQINVGDKVRFVNSGENAHNIMGSFSRSGEAMDHEHGDHDHGMGNETDDDEESPALALLVSMAVIGCVAVLRRRYTN